MYATPLALGSALGFGSGDFLGGLASRRARTQAVVVVSQLFGLALILGLITLLPSSHPTVSDALWGAAAGLAGGVGVLLLYKGLATGPMSLVAPVTAVSASVLPVGIGLTLGERPSLGAACGVFVALPAIALVSSVGRPSAGGPRGTASVLLLALAAGAAIGVFYVALQRVGTGAGLWPLASARAASIAALLALDAARRCNPIPPLRTLPATLAAGGLDMGGNILFLLAVGRGLLSTASVLSSLYPAATLLLAAIVLHERLRRAQAVGVVVAAVAVLLIASG